ncbi:MAG: DEAD/DEAH box helicase, partial [Candidatus Poribacteria bacterium]
MKYARVVFPLPQELAFTYLIPDRLQSTAQPGSRVLAPLGRSVREGVIVALMEDSDLPDLSIEIKKLTDCLDTTPTFSDELLSLTKWIAEYYMSSGGEALQCAVPAAVRTQQHRIVHLLATEAQIEEMRKRMPVQAQILVILRVSGDLSPNQVARRMGRSYSKIRPVLSTLQEKGLVELRSGFQSKTTPQNATVISLTKPFAEIEEEIESLSKRAPKQAEILQMLIDESETTPVYATDVTKRANTSLMSLRSLERKGLIRMASVQVIRSPLSLEPVAPTLPLSLNTDQATALEAIRKAISSAGALSHRIFLLHGVTGSGKTEVYMQAIAAVLESGKGAIVLVPEIALTPQTVSRFVGRFGSQVAVLHSRLSDGERYDQWHRLRTGQANIVVGPRSAVFAPIPNLGIIVIDEEHETTYKQEDA